MATPTIETPEQQDLPEEPRTPVLNVLCPKRLDFEDTPASRAEEMDAGFSDRVVVLREGVTYKEQEREEEAVSETAPLKRARTEIIPEAEQEGENEKKAE